LVPLTYVDILILSLGLLRGLARRCRRTAILRLLF